MHGDVSHLMRLKERLERRKAEHTLPGRPENHAPENGDEEPPGALLDTRSHAADIHNRRRGFECVRIHYGAGASITLPYIGMGAIDAPYDGKLVLEHSHRTVTITGARLHELHMLLEQRQVEAVSIASGNDDRQGYAVEDIRVEKAEG
ncbi:MAG: hypothetical protein QM756_16335 [Polyangiaceae bacterium]